MTQPNPGDRPALATRADNPFATCWTRPGAMQWIDCEGPSVSESVDRLLAWGIGQLVGPHGAGKSTLAAAMEAELRRRGVPVARTGWGDRRPAWGRRVRGGLMIVDGFERAQPPTRWWLALRCRFGVTGLLITTHRPMGWPIGQRRVVADLLPTWRTVEQVFRSLTADRPSPVRLEDAAQSYQRHGANLREIGFDLYDLHERYVRRDRTQAADQ